MKTKTHDAGSEFIAHLILLFLFAWFAMLLWGAFIPALFGLPTIGY